LQEMGVAAEPLSTNHLDPQTLGRAIAVAEDADTRARAAALGRAMATEDGVGRAVGIIEQWQRPTNGRALPG
jgi:sterol 3beta-glucosyltransferase